MDYLPRSITKLASPPEQSFSFGPGEGTTVQLKRPAGVPSPSPAPRAPNMAPKSPPAATPNMNTAPKAFQGSVVKAGPTNQQNYPTGVRNMLNTIDKGMQKLNINPPQ